MLPEGEDCVVSPGASFFAREEPVGGLELRAI